MYCKNRSCIFYLSLFAVILGYICFSWYHLAIVPFAYDEFWFSNHIFRYLHSMPYRDFIPYKTALGYYVSAPIFLLSSDLIKPLFYVRTEMVLISAAMLAFSSWWLKKYYDARAIILALAIVVFSFTFLHHSIQIRTDLLSAWFGLITVILLLENRVILSGLSLGLAFLISQKALWFIVATDVALLVQFILLHRNAQYFKKIFILNLSLLGTVFLYCIFWAIVASPYNVFYGMFYEPYIQIKLDVYNWLRPVFLREMFALNPSFMALFPLCLLPACYKSNAQDYSRRIFIITYAFTIVALLLSYKQPFPYNFVVLAPSFLLLYSDFFTWLFGDSFVLRDMLSMRVCYYYLGFCFVVIVAVTSYFYLPNIYYALACLPFLIGLFLYLPEAKQAKKIIKTIIVVLVLWCGVAYTFAILIADHKIHNNDYQLANLRLAHAILGDSNSYFGGTHFFYDRDQQNPYLKNLIASTLYYLRHHNPKDLPAMLQSLDIVAGSRDEVLSSLQNEPVRIFINNIRLKFLPEELLDFLSANYKHYWGSIYVYAPKIRPGRHKIKIAFPGDYKIIVPAHADILLDGNRVAGDNVLYLRKGSHLSDSNSMYRLQLHPRNVAQFATMAIAQEQLQPGVVQ